MCKRNATASWSGYSYQGQVGLLVALRKLQEIGINLNTNYVQFETHEDAAIYEENVGGTKTYLTVHQIKAYYSPGNKNKSSYNDVLNGVFEPGDERYIHTVVEITDWDTSLTTNTNNILRYPYSSTQNYCSTTEIESFIKTELANILNPASSGVIDMAYYRLSFELDNRIRREHKKASKNLFDIKFSLNEINEIIRSNEEFISKEIYECRKLFYDTYIEIVTTDNIDQLRVNSIENNIIKNINDLDDKNFQLLLQRMNLNCSAKQLQCAPTYYNRDGLRQVFFRMIIEIIDTDPFLLENVVKYCKKDQQSTFVLTAIIDEEQDQLSVIENILSNLKSQNLLWESHSLINKEIQIDLMDRNPNINVITTTEEKENDRNKFMFFSDSKLVKREEAKAKLNNGTNS